MPLIEHLGQKKNIDFFLFVNDIDAERYPDNDTKNKIT